LSERTVIALHRQHSLVYDVLFTALLIRSVYEFSLEVGCTEGG